MIIRNTTTEAQHPWPDDVVVQGGGNGLVVSPGASRRTAFVEAFPPGTFIRGEGDTLAEAETRCWEKYQRVVTCAGSDTGRHGPFEARTYRNGAGFCTGCGAWFANVLAPEFDQVVHHAALDELKAEYGMGHDIIATGRYKELIADRQRIIREFWATGVRPDPQVAPLTAEEVADAERPIDPAELHAVLARIAGVAASDEEKGGTS